MTIRFLGVWDTVGAMGIPEVIPGSDWFNREYDYHDPSLDAFVEFARHAVAIDERREFFPVILFDDVDKRSEEHTSELQSLMRISYAVFCLKKKKPPHQRQSEKVTCLQTNDKQ